MGISFTISISGKPIENEYPIDVFIRAKRNFITWRQKVRDNDVQLAYLETEPMVSNMAIEVNDHLKELRNSNTEIVTATTANTLISESPNLIFTTITKDTNFGNSPVFYAHRIPRNATQVTFSPWNKATESSVALFSTYYSAIFSDLENYIDMETGAYNASYVKYSYPSPEGDGAISVKTEVYNKQPFFREMTSFDLEFDASLGDFYVASNKGLYQKTLQANGKWLYVIYKDPGTTVYYKEDQEATGKIVVSENIKSQYQWPLEIKGSGVVCSTTLPDETVVKYSYDWSEERVDYFPYAPYVTLKKEAYIINDRTVLVPDKNIILDPSLNLHLTLRVMRNEAILFAQTTRPELIDIRISGSYVRENIIKYESFTGNVDYSLGVISLVSSYPLLEGDKVLVEYVVSQARSEKVIGNVNPAQNKKLLDSNILYYATPVSGTTKSKIGWVSYSKGFNTITSDFEYFVSEVSDTNLVSYKGKKLSLFIDDYFIRNPYSGSYNINTNNYLPLGTVSFDKTRYLNKTKHKDLRVYSGVKDDLMLERKGRDFAFSNILNPSGMYDLDLTGQTAIFIDKTEIQNKTTKDIETIINNNIKVGLIPHIIYLNRPKPLFVKCENISDSLFFSIKIKSTITWKYLNVYMAVNKTKMSENDIELLSLNLADNLLAASEDYIVIGNTIDPGILSPSSIIDGKIYFYLKWVSETGVESDKSSISCVHIK